MDRRFREPRLMLRRIAICVAELDKLRSGTRQEFGYPDAESLDDFRYSSWRPESLDDFRYEPVLARMPGCLI